MTGPAPGADAHADALRRLVHTLDDAVAATVVLAADVAASWQDGEGASWAARLALLGRELARQAGVAGAGGGVAAARAGARDVGGAAAGARPAPPAGPAWTWPTSRVPAEDAAGWSLPGVRLGGTDGGRASERRGTVVPALPDPPG